jgi:hypothetical protein
MLHPVWATNSDGASGRWGCCLAWAGRFVVPVIVAVVVIGCCANLDVIVRVIVEIASGGTQ